MDNQEKIAEFIGIMLGDGSIGVYKTKAHDKIKMHRVVKVTLDSRNKIYASHVAELMREVLGTEPRINIKKNENAMDISTHKKDRLEYATKTLGLEISPKWGKMKIPLEYEKGNLSLP